MVASVPEMLEALVSSVVDDMVEAGVWVPLVGIDSMLPVESYVVEGCSMVAYVRMSIIEGEGHQI